MSDYADADRRLYCGNLSLTLTEVELRQQFSAAGFEVADAFILHDQTGRSRGSGFVTLVRADQAEQAIQQLDRTLIRGRQIRVAWPKRRSGVDAPSDEHEPPRPLAPGCVRLFIGNLRYDTPEADLEAHLATMAQPTDVWAVRSVRDGHRFAFADVAAADVERVLRLDGVALHGRELRIQVAGRQA